MTANSQISDAARSITHREQESEALRQAIREEMYGGDWEGVPLPDRREERRFGYKLEPRSCATRMNQVREMTIREQDRAGAGPHREGCSWTTSGSGPGRSQSGS